MTSLTPPKQLLLIVSASARRKSAEQPQAFRVCVVPVFHQPADASKQTSSAQEFTIVMRRAVVQHTP